MKFEDGKIIIDDKDFLRSMKHSIADPKRLYLRRNVHTAQIL
jgi:hypothetical protein